MNLQVLSKSRKKPKPGDVFVMLPPDGKYLFGRVIANDSKPSGMDDSNLIYVYRVRAEQKQPVPELRPDELLVPPKMTNRLPWSRGYFEFVEHRPLEPGDVLEQHCFREPMRDRYYDEYNHELPGPVEPVGIHALDSFRTIDDAVSDALGIPRAPD